VPHRPNVTALTDIGRARKRNEDAFATKPDAFVAVVADGMGGHPGGDVASRIAADTVAELLARAESSEGMPEVMRDAVLEAHRRIRGRGEEEPHLDGMGTTVTAIILDPETDRYVLGHVGDSRGYRFRNGELEQLTRDDTWVQERIEQGDISPEAGRKHPFGHLLTQCLGLEEDPVPHVLEGEVEIGDLFLLCSDGLVGMVEDDTIAEMISSYLSELNVESTDEDTPVLQVLLNAANAAGGYDNITAALVRIAPTA
jgi:protein phosphatase